MTDRGIDVLLVDDHLIVRDGIAAVLGSTDHINVCGHSAAGLEAVNLAIQLKPDVIVMDIGLPDINGLEATRRIVQDWPAARVVVLTVYDNSEYVLRAARVGARGYLVKNSSAAQLLQAIETVHGGRLCFPESLFDQVVDELAGRLEDDGVDLTRRECEVLALIADGLSNRDVARHLEVSVRTVECHRRRVMDKLAIHTVAGLTKYAIGAGLTRID